MESNFSYPLSPMVVFAYNRSEHTLRLLDSLSVNPEAKESLLYIFCDGPKPNAAEQELKKIYETRETAKGEKRFGQVVVRELSANKGLAHSIVDGVTEVINRHGTAIVLEDDLLVSPYFLYYMNDSLQRYKNDMRVGEIGACNMFACGRKYPLTFFIPIPDCLGWATWQNRWEHFTSDSASLLNKLRSEKLMNKFNAYGSYDMEGLLTSQVNGNSNSWAVRWTAVCVLNNWLTLYPNPSLTNHIASADATNATIDIKPPMPLSKPIYTTVSVIEIHEVIEAMKRGYAGTGDYWGNLKNAGDTVAFSIPANLKSLWRKLKGLYSRE